MRKKNTSLSGYYFDGKKSYELHQDAYGNSFMKEAAEVQQGYRDNVKYKLKQLQEIDDEHSKT